MIKATKTHRYERTKRIMVTVQEKLRLATKKLKKSTEDSKNLCEDEIEKAVKKYKLQKSKLELHLPEFRSLVEELRPTDNDINETDLEKGYEELDGISDAATVTLMKINNKIEYLNEQLEKEEKL